MKRLCFVVLFLAISACAPRYGGSPSYYGGSPTYQPASQPQLRSTTETESTNFESAIKVNGIEEEHGYRPYGLPINRYFLRSLIDKKTARVIHQLYVVDYYEGSGWKFWNRANAEGGTPLEFISIKRDVGSCSGSSGCSHYEHFAVTLSDEMLRGAIGDFPIKAYAKDGTDKILRITTRQRQAQIAAVDRERAAIIATLPPKVEDPPQPSKGATKKK